MEPEDAVIEANISTCTVLDGEVKAWLVPELGLDVHLEHSSRGVAELLSYSTTRKEEGWPKECKD